mmetsp:Transcript_142846/g.397927  ORF Transcript_142846/g.397927 Transcript_142846/m.397927 type:complete len:413 (-) Transcript_142846:96-1334(-)
MGSLRVCIASKVAKARVRAQRSRTKPKCSPREKHAAHQAINGELAALLSTAEGQALDQRADEVILDSCLSGGAGCSFPFPLREQFVDRCVAPFAAHPDPRLKWELLQAAGPVVLALDGLHAGHYRAVTQDEHAEQLASFLHAVVGSAEDFCRRVQKEDFAPHAQGSFLDVLEHELQDEIHDGDDEAALLLQTLQRAREVVPANRSLHRAFRRAVDRLDHDVRRLRAQITPLSVLEEGREVLLVGHSNLHLLEHQLGKEGRLRPWDPDPWQVQDIVEALQQSPWFIGGRAPVLCNDLYPSHRSDLMLNLFRIPLEELGNALPLAHFRAVVICGIPLTQQEYDAGTVRFAALLRPGGQLVVSTGGLVRREQLPETLEPFGRFCFHTKRMRTGKLLTTFIRHRSGSLFVARKPIA